MPIVNVSLKLKNIRFSCEDGEGRTHIKHAEEDFSVLPETRATPEASISHFQRIPELHIYMPVSLLYLDDSRIQIRCSLYYICTNVPQQLMFFSKAVGARHVSQICHTQICQSEFKFLAVEWRDNAVTESVLQFFSSV